MPLRIIALMLVVLLISGYAWRNWFHSLLGAIVMFAFTQHPEMPRLVLGIPGLNPWNLMVIMIGAAWLTNREVENDAIFLPQSIKIAFSFYLAVVVIAAIRAIIDPTLYFQGTRSDIVFEYLFNPLKFLLPALMLYDGCRTRERVVFALGAILSLYFLLALQTIKAMGLHFDLSSGPAMASRASRILDRQVGYQRIDLSMMCAGGSWGAIAFARLFRRWTVKVILWGGAGVILLGQAVTGGRTGYATWILIGLILCTVKWRKVLPIIPVTIILVLTFVPAVRERMLQGFAQKQGGVVEQADASEVTSGRTDIWPYVIDEIAKAPVIGNGRVGFVRTGLADFNLNTFGDYFSHPHNAYLEILLDNGVLGSLVAMPIYFILLWLSLRLFLDNGDVLYEATGGVALALLLALFVAGIGAQTFYPREGVVGMWAALAVALRVWVQRRFPGADDPLFETDCQEEGEYEDSREEWSPSH
jgi:O-antigen ligase